jgi:hypothetical protein
MNRQVCDRCESVISEEPQATLSIIIKTLDNKEIRLGDLCESCYNSFCDWLHAFSKKKDADIQPLKTVDKYYWRKNDIAILKRDCKNTPVVELSKKLNRSEQSIKNKMIELKLV